MWASPAIAADGTVIIGSVDGSLYTLNSLTGTSSLTAVSGFGPITRGIAMTENFIYVAARES